MYDYLDAEGTPLRIGNLVEDFYSNQGEIIDMAAGEVRVYWEGQGPCWEEPWELWRL